MTLPRNARLFIIMDARCIDTCYKILPGPIYMIIYTIEDVSVYIFYILFIWLWSIGPVGK